MANIKMCRLQHVLVYFNDTGVLSGTFVIHEYRVFLVSVKYVETTCNCDYFVARFEIFYKLNKQIHNNSSVLL